LPYSRRNRLKNPEPPRQRFAIKKPRIGGVFAIGRTSDGQIEYVLAFAVGFLGEKMPAAVFAAALTQTPASAGFFCLDISE
jgi:hypothetical protein